MRVINVILIKHGAVHEIDSFGVFEEQLSQEIVDQAEKKFKEKVLEVSNECEEEFEDNHSSIESFIEDGRYQRDSQTSVCLTWSEIE